MTYTQLNKTLQCGKKTCYENIQSYTENKKEPFWYFHPSLRKGKYNKGRCKHRQTHCSWAVLTKIY